MREVTGVAVPTGPRQPQQPQRANGFVRFLLTAAAGISAWVFIALFASHGQVHLFAAGAFATGIGLAALAGVARWLSRVRWREVIGLAALSDLLGSLFGWW